MVDKQEPDTQVRYMAPVLITVIVTLLMAELIWLFLWAFEIAPTSAGAVRADSGGGHPGGAGGFGSTSAGNWKG